MKKNNIVYTAIKNEIAKFSVPLPPSAAIAGIYASVDNNSGVWKTPANISLRNVTAPSVSINDVDQQALYVDVNAGKSINVIRNFPGKGTVIWGARTLAGNDNEWRYISVCRFFVMAENSVQNALKSFVLESNDNITWATVKSMISDFLYVQWMQGALQRAKPEEA